MTASRRLRSYETAQLRSLGSQLASAQRGSDERSFLVRHVVILAEDLKLTGVCFKDTAAELSITESSLRRWRHREADRAIRSHLIASNSSALPRATYNPIASLTSSDHVQRPAEERPIEPRRHHTELLTFREGYRRPHEQRHHRSPLVVLGLSGPNSEGRRYELEMSTLRGILTSHRHHLVEKAGINVTELAHEANKIQPTVLHLATHVDEIGVWMVDRTTDRPIRWDLLLDQLGRFQTQPELIVLSCCHSSTAAETVAHWWQGTLAIGCDGVVPDDTARIWAETFYEQWLRHPATTSSASPIRSAVADAVYIANTQIASHHPSARWKYHLYPSVDGLHNSPNAEQDPIPPRWPS